MSDEQQYLPVQHLEEEGKLDNTSDGPGEGTGERNRRYHMQCPFSPPPLHPPQKTNSDTVIIRLNLIILDPRSLILCGIL